MSKIKVCIIGAKGHQAKKYKEIMQNDWEFCNVDTNFTTEELQISNNFKNFRNIL